MKIGCKPAGERGSNNRGKRSGDKKKEILHKNDLNQESFREKEGRRRLARGGKGGKRGKNATEGKKVRDCDPKRHQASRNIRKGTPLGE